MAEIRAFVGHSFTEDDKALVASFLDYLDVIKNMNIGFTWQHAEAAEPKELSRKVLSLMREKNVFVGICTHKEQVIEADLLKPVRMKKNQVTANRTDFEGKTSDWIIQEIGVAVGLEMDLILLMEEGLRPPGGLQGNVEYIPFQRQYPDRSFKKLLEMIQSLRPRTTEKPGAEPERQAAPPDSTEADEASDDIILPLPTWSRQDYEYALMYTIIVEDSRKEQDIYNSYLKTESGGKSENRASWEACRELHRLKYAKGELRTLERYAQEHPENNEVLKFLGHGYKYYEEFSKAGPLYERAAKTAKDQVHMLARLKDAAIAYMRADMKDESARMLKNMRDLGQTEEDLLVLLTALQETARIDNDKQRLFAVSEYLLEFRPDDVDVRFSLAYDYSNSSEDELSLFHYTRIPPNQRKQLAWNNLGVQCEHFKMPAKAVESYRESEKLGETLAMSNLAKRLIAAGFLQEANEICQKAVRIENYHQNIAADISRIREIPNEEEKIEQEAVKRGKALSEFYREFGRALIDDEVAKRLGKWQGPDCELTIEIDRRTFTAEGSYSRSRPKGLGGIYNMTVPSLMAEGLQTTPDRTVTYRVRYEGQIDGRAVRSTISVREDGAESAPTNLLSGLGSETKRNVLMIMSKSFEELRVLEKGESDGPKFYSIVKINN